MQHFLAQFILIYSFGSFVLLRIMAYRPLQGLTELVSILHANSSTVLLFCYCFVSLSSVCLDMMGLLEFGMRLVLLHQLTNVISG